MSGFGVGVVATAVIGFCTFMVYGATHPPEASVLCYKQMNLVYTYPEARPIIDNAMKDKKLTVVECDIIIDEYHDIRDRREQREQIKLYEQKKGK